MPGARFVGVGVGEYDHGHEALGHAVPDVEAVARLLGRSFECTLLQDPDEQSAKELLTGLRGSMPEGGSLVLLWSGHALSSLIDGPRLLARNSQGYKTSGLGITGDASGPCAESGASQLLFIIDTCFSGEAARAVDVVARILQESAPAGQHAWVGVLTSCLPMEKARDGLFGESLIALLKSGPEPGPDVKDLLVRRWSPQNELITGYDLCDALLKIWVSPAHNPVFGSSGSAWWMFRNPLYDAGAPERVVEHLLLAARGGADPDERSWFTGRVPEVDQVVAWVRSGVPGLHVVTGSAGTGKTAIVGRVVSLSNPAERERLLGEGRPIGHADPGEGSVAAHVHARGLTADRAADLLAGQLVRAGVLAVQEERRNAAELVGQVQRAVEQGAPPPVIVVDGLDEARAHTFAIAEDLLLRLAPYAVVIVSTRERRRGETEPSLLDVLTAGRAELDLDDPAAQERGRADMHAYIAGRLAGLDERMDPAAVAGYLAGTASMTGGSPFLLARLVTDQLRAAPVDTSAPGWEDRVSHSVEDAFDADLARVQGSGESARVLLAALTWGLGAGLPEEEWLACAGALADGEFDAGDVGRVLDELGRYIIQDGEAGVAVYRIAHQSLADHIRPPFAATYGQVFDPQARPVAAALLGRYEGLLADGVPATDPGYLWRYAWRHAAAAGPDGLDLIRHLAAGEPRLRLDVALADQEVSGRLADWGYRLEAVAPAEEAANLFRSLAEADPALRTDLASALNDLGIRYSGLGRRQDALVPTEEAVQRYRALAADNPAYLPDLAGALNNLGIRYSELGRRQDALAPTEEAVQRYRALAADNPAYLPDLAKALNNLGVFYSELGRRQDALAPTEEAVQLRRALAADNPAYLPDLAGALNNLGIRYSELGRRQDALAPTEEAVQLRRALAADNPAYLPDLASALNNLGIRYSDLGRRQDALTPTEEAVQRYRALAADNPAYLPDLASALNNLGDRYSEAGTPDRGEAAWEQAIAEAEPSAAAYLLLARANRTDEQHPAAAGWLVRALSLGGHDRGLAAAVHGQARRYRSLHPDAFDQSWMRETGGPVPAWLAVDPELLNTAQAWVNTDTYTAEHDHLAAHHELLEPAADAAVDEALLVVSEDEAARYTALRQAARQDGVDAAYRPLLLAILAREFADADPDRQRELLAERCDDLLSDVVGDALGELSGEEGEGATAAQRAVCLLNLARAGDDEPVFAALVEPGRFPPLLHALAVRADGGSVVSAAMVAFTVATADAEAAGALFYLAVGRAINGDRDQAADLMRQLREADADRVPGWINELAGIGRQHPGVLALIPVLTTGDGG